MASVRVIMMRWKQRNTNGNTLVCPVGVRAKPRLEYTYSTVLLLCPTVYPMVQENIDCSLPHPAVLRFAPPQAPHPGTGLYLWQARKGTPRQAIHGLAFLLVRLGSGENRGERESSRRSLLSDIWRSEERRWEWEDLSF